MITGTLYQPQRLIFAVAVGVILGALFDITLIPSLFSKFRAAMVVVFDLVYFALAAVVYILLSYKFVGLDITWYMATGTAAGFILERKSIAIMLAKFYQILYNLFARIKARRGGKTNDCRKT